MKVVDLNSFIGNSWKNMVIFRKKSYADDLAPKPHKSITVKSDFFSQLLFRTLIHHPPRFMAVFLKNSNKKYLLKTFPVILSCSFYSPFLIRTFYTVSLSQTIYIAINALLFEENRSKEEKSWKRRIDILQWDKDFILPKKKQLHKGEQNVTKWISSVLSIIDQLLIFVL